MNELVLDKLEEGVDLVEVLLRRLNSGVGIDDIVQKLMEWAEETRDMLDSNYFCPTCGDILLKAGEVYSCGEHHWKVWQAKGVTKMKEVDEPCRNVDIETREYELAEEGENAGATADKM